MCNCFGGWSGEKCTERACPGGCSGRGKCGDDGVCACEEGWTWKDCSRKACPGGCSGNGYCFDGECVCRTGYTGVDCAVAHACPDACGGPTRGVCELPPIPPPPPPWTVGHALLRPPSPSPPAPPPAPCADGERSSARARAPLPPRLLRRRLLAEGVRQEVRAQRLLRPRDGRVRVRGGVDGADVQPQALREGVLGPRHLRRDDGRLHVRPGVRRRRLRDEGLRRPPLRRARRVHEGGPARRRLLPKTDAACACDGGWTGAACEKMRCPGAPLECSGAGWCLSLLGAVRRRPAAAAPTAARSRARRTTRRARQLGAVARDVRREDGQLGVCIGAWAGAACDTLPCELNCSKRGRCEASTGMCICAPGWGGALCERPACAAHLGLECGGRARGWCDVERRECICRAGWTGPSCSTRRAVKCPNDCRGHGQCVASYEGGAGAGLPACVCDKGWQGVDCSRPACPGNCSGHGGRAADATCACDAGWSGEMCELGTCPNDCDGHGACQPDGSCACYAFTSGVDCSVHACVDDCGEAAGRGAAARQVHVRVGVVGPRVRARHLPARPLGARALRPAPRARAARASAGSRCEIGCLNGRSRRGNCTAAGTCACAGGRRGADCSSGAVWRCAARALLVRRALRGRVRAEPVGARGGRERRVRARVRRHLPARVRAARAAGGAGGRSSHFLGTRRMRRWRSPSARSVRRGRLSECRLGPLINSSLTHTARPLYLPREGLDLGHQRRDGEDVLGRTGAARVRVLDEVEEARVVEESNWVSTCLSRSMPSLKLANDLSTSRLRRLDPRLPAVVEGLEQTLHRARSTRARVAALEQQRLRRLDVRDQPAVVGGESAPRRTSPSPCRGAARSAPTLAAGAALGEHT